MHVDSSPVYFDRVGADTTFEYNIFLQMHLAIGDDEGAHYAGTFAHFQSALL